MNGGFLRSTQMVFKLESSLLNPKDALVPISLMLHHDRAKRCSLFISLSLYTTALGLQIFL